MTKTKDLIEHLASMEGGRVEFLAPVLRGVAVRARVGGLVRRYVVRQRDFEGFAVVHPVDEKSVAVVDEPRPAQVERYLELLPALRVILVRPWRGAWLALPWNRSDARQRFGGSLADCLALRVRLVGEGRPFDVVVARADGRLLLFHDLDRARDPRVAAELRAALEAQVSPSDLSGKGLTPELRLAYATAFAPLEEIAAERKRRPKSERLRRQVALGGGSLVGVEDRGNYLLVTLTDRAGVEHTVAVEGDDLTVASAGICLSGADRDFDLASIVGVLSES